MRRGTDLFPLLELLVLIRSPFAELLDFALAVRFIRVLERRRLAVPVEILRAAVDAVGLVAAAAMRRGRADGGQRHGRRGGTARVYTQKQNDRIFESAKRCWTKRQQTLTLVQFTKRKEEQSGWTRGIPRSRASGNACERISGSSIANLSCPSHINLSVGEREEGNGEGGKWSLCELDFITQLNFPPFPSHFFALLADRTMAPFLSRLRFG